jgi:hypothetical protein
VGKLKNLAYACWELWQHDTDNPDWVSIGNEMKTSPLTAKALAIGWEHAQDEKELHDDSEY